ncbi:MAG TPA: aspartate kinase [Blastocatellia bacterium]|nr:aspartate kinase [Blastocatellia bacterium]
MIVMKFGGTSVEDAASIERVTEIVRARLDLKPVIVVSAMGKTTRKLLAAAEASADGDSRTALGFLADLKTRHTSEVRRLVQKATGRLALPLIEQHFDELKTLLEGLAILGEVPPRGLDKILAYGELLSSYIVADAMAERGIRTRLLDARELIKTDDRYGGASPLSDLTNRAIVEKIAPVLEQGEVPVVQGFIGSTRDGATTTLGFEGSDYTASIIGAALNAEDIQIWKDVPGLMTADPHVFGGARTVKACSFAEAADLTFLGAKVLHAKAIYPAARKKIPVHIYNSKQPDATGTSIGAAAPRSTSLIKSIAYRRPVTIIRARADTTTDGSREASADDLLKALLDTLAKRRARALFTAVSSSHVVVALDSRELKHGGRDLIESIAPYGSATAEPDKAIVSLVGEELGSDPSAVSRAVKAMDDTKLSVILHGSSPISVSFVVDQSEVEGVIARLHEVFFSEADPALFD